MNDVQARKPRPRRNGKASSSRPATPAENPFQARPGARQVVTSVDQILALGRSNFGARNYPRPQESKYLLKGPPSYHELAEKVDPWDAQNQARLLSREQQIGNGSGAIKQLATEFQQMREEERREMEQRGLVDRLDTRKALSDAIVFIGTCQTMCPTFERIRRTYENDIKNLEREPDGTVSARRAVKAFSRPAAGQPPALPSDVRPPRVLMETLAYLVSEIVPQLPKSQSFLWDRTRSIRQDFTYQHYVGYEAIVCNEVIVRIHLLTLHIMAGDPGDYSSQQEIEQLNKALQTLDHVYRESRARGMICENEPEFRAYQLLSHLKNPEMDYMVSTLPTNVARHPYVVLAQELRALAASASREALIALFFKRIRQPDVPVLFQCLAETHFVPIRLSGLQALSRSLHRKASRKYSLARFEQMFGFDAGTSSEFLKYYDVPFDNEFLLLENFNEQTAADKQTMAQPCEKFISDRLDFSVLAFPGISAQARGPSDFEIRRFVDKMIAAQVRGAVQTAQQKVLRQKLQNKRAEEAQRVEQAEREKAERERAAQEKAQREQAEREARERSERAAAEAKAEAKRVAAVHQAEQERLAAVRREEAAKRQRREQLRDEFVSRVSATVLSQLLTEVELKVKSDVAILVHAENQNRSRLVHRVFRRLRSQAKAFQLSQRRARETTEAAALLRAQRPRRVRSRSQHHESIDETHLSQLFRKASQSPATPSSPALPVSPGPIDRSIPQNGLRASQPAPKTKQPTLKRPVDVLDVPSLRAKKPVTAFPIAPPPRPRVPAVPHAIQNLRNLISKALSDV